MRRQFYEIQVKTPAPIATQALVRIAALYAIETDIRGLSADERRQARQRRTKPLIDDLRLWLEAQLAAVSGKATIAGAIRYTLSRWDSLTRFLDDGRIEINSNVVERAIRPIALGRKNHLFAGSDGSGEHWAVIASLIETALCRARHKAVYAARRTMPNGSGGNPSFARNCGPSSGDRPSSIRHSLASYSASRKASRRSLGRKRVCLPRSYGLSFARAASLSARWACR